jgi:uncharacterized damage-inducible protein DinB
MLPELVSTATTFAFNGRSLSGLVKDFTEEDWAVQDACGHSPRWIVGHLATYRHRVLELMGLPSPAAPWAGAFARGTATADVPAEVDMKEVISAFRVAQAQMADRWDGLTQDDLSKTTGRKMPDGSEDIGGAIRFLAWHETYHLGQLGLLRRLAGRPGLA